MSEILIIRENMSVREVANPLSLDHQRNLAHGKQPEKGALDLKSWIQALHSHDNLPHSSVLHLNADVVGSSL
jgi:hypothetical protein